jgi:hypothetical protein
MGPQQWNTPLIAEDLNAGIEKVVKENADGMNGKSRSKK